MKELTRSACLALLAAGGRGRVAATMRALPIIIPVSFTMFGDDIVFSIERGEGLYGTVADSVVAFETDYVGSDGCALWDVHVTGIARMLAPKADRQCFRLSSESMAGGRASR